MFDALSKRELEVLQQIAEGLSDKVICRNLSISYGTCRTHAQRILKKIRADNRTHAAVLYLRHIMPKAA
jgi:two-component system nitrate/nitrite response regulator NarP